MFGKKVKSEAELNAEFLPETKYMEAVSTKQFYKVIKAAGMPDKINPVNENGDVLPWAVDYMKEHEPVWAKCYYTVWAAIAFADQARATGDNLDSFDA